MVSLRTHTQAVLNRFSKLCLCVYKYACLPTYVYVYVYEITAVIERKAINLYGSRKGRHGRKKESRGDFKSEINF